MAKTAPRATSKRLCLNSADRTRLEWTLGFSGLLATGTESHLPGGAQVLLLGGLLPGPPPLGSLEALGWRGILWPGPSRPPRSASAGPPPRAPPPLFLPEGRRAQASAARQRPGGSAGKLSALALRPAPSSPLMREARQASFWTRSWKCFLSVGSLSPLCSTDIQDHRPRDWTPLRLHRAATLSCRARLQPLPPGHRLARSAAVAGLRWFWQWH